MNAPLVTLVLLIACANIATGQQCFFCATCPVPFNSYDARVTTQYSSTGFCAKKSLDPTPGAAASRGPAEPGLCSISGCFYRTYTTQPTLYYCCCQGNRCNTGSFTSKSTTAVLLGALTLLALRRYI